MFTPNLKGTLEKVVGRDIHGRPTLGAAIPCPFGSISLKVSAQETTVRADSSASRGNADEMVTERGRILIPAFIKPSQGDIFTFNGMRYKIASLHDRYSIGGKLDHWECDLESYVG
jgi:hypothetical protein